MPTQDKYARWRTLLASNRIPQVLEELRSVFAQSDRLSEIIHQSGRHAALSEGIRKGDIGLEDEMVVENQIRLGVLDLLKDIERWEGEDLALEQDLAQVMINITGSVSNAAINSTITAGGNVQIGDIYYGTEPIPHFLTAQPQNPPVFKGRDEQLKELHDQLFSVEEGHVILLVNGQAGVGKTSMVSRYFFDYQHEYSHIAWVLKIGSIQEALLTLEQGLNLEFTDETAPQRLEIILQKVANLQAPCLLIVDHANDHDDLIKHVHILRQCANFHVLVTSRLDYFDGTQSYKLPPLPLSVAKPLFEQYYQAFNEEEVALFPEVYRAVDGNTLVLQLLAKNLKKNRRKYFLPDLLADLQSKGVQQLSASRKVVTDYGNLNEGGIEEIVAAMYELGDLDEQQLSLLSVFAALPPEKIPYDHLEILVNFLDDLDEALDQLQQHGWLEESQEGRNTSLRCSPVIQAVVRQKNEGWKAVLPALRSNIKDYLETDESDNILGIKAVRQFVVYGEALRLYLPREHANDSLLKQLKAFYTASGDLRSAYNLSVERTLLMKELLAAEPESAEIKDSLAGSYGSLGQTHSQLGNLSEAFEYFTLFNSLEKELHATYPNNPSFKDRLSISYDGLGETHIQLGNPDEALQCFHLAMALSEELYAAYPDNVEYKFGVSLSYMRLGDTHRLLGNHNEELEFNESALALKKELCAAYPDNFNFKNHISLCYSALGSIHESLGDLNKALSYLESHHVLSKELYDAQPDNLLLKKVLALSYGTMGLHYIKREKFSEALEFIESGFMLSKELYEDSPDDASFKNALVLSYSLLEIIHGGFGNQDLALEYGELKAALLE